MAKAKNAAGEPKAAAKKKVTKPKEAAPAPAKPMIDTDLAAKSAAARVAAGFSPAGPAKVGASSTPAKESSSFKNLKDSLTKPTSGLANLLNNTAGPGQKQSNTPFQGGKQVGRNQTFGADVNRTGVPRRTGGG